MGQIRASNTRYGMGVEQVCSKTIFAKIDRYLPSE